MDISLLDIRREPNERQDWIALSDAGIDAARELEAVTSSLHVLRMDDEHGTAGPIDQLVELHAALLLFQLGGRAELLPATGFSLFGGWSVERRIVRAASRLAGTARGEDAAFGTWLRAGERIESLIGLIDPELCQLVA